MPKVLVFVTQLLEIVGVVIFAAHAVVPLDSRLAVDHDPRVELDPEKIVSLHSCRQLVFIVWPHQASNSLGLCAHFPAVSLKLIRRVLIVSRFVVVWVDDAVDDGEDEVPAEHYEQEQRDCPTKTCLIGRLSFESDSD